MKQRKQKPSKRPTHSTEFKARVALEALKGVKTINQIAQEEGIHPVHARAWKKELQERLPEVFASKGSVSAEREQAERNQARLERKVGQLLIEKEFLEKSAVSWESIRAKDHDGSRSFQAPWSRVLVHRPFRRRGAGRLAGHIHAALSAPGPPHAPLDSFPDDQNLFTRQVQGKTDFRGAGSIVMYS